MNGDGDQNHQQAKADHNSPQHALPQRPTRQLWRLLGVLCGPAEARRKLWCSAQNACPKVTKNCVLFTPGGAFRLWPISKRIGPTGVAYRNPMPKVLVYCP